MANGHGLAAQLVYGIGEVSGMGTINAIQLLGDPQMMGPFEPAHRELAINLRSWLGEQRAKELVMEVSRTEMRDEKALKAALKPSKEQVAELFAQLTDEERHLIIGDYCGECGKPRPCNSCRDIE